jgi:hypothetical protein
MVNHNFSDRFRIPIMGASIFFTLFGVVRLQFSGKFRPFPVTSEYSEYLHLIIVLGFLLASFVLIPFKGAKVIQNKLL